ncbi:Ig-like domain-containing protein [Rummeliibacillus suwonensis]|uniref:Ig-like domain-containing protein n=1 Tax=Rummeliibacillus suwonensis TaxID=1306154 RepID=UPI001AAE4B6C|nr:Ig-like domain-containing protein [Rummeliibacillus suwonensis]MBO2535670.1 Ig-like domain-containing protein [Rummeliibacillus suwonensis]
MANFKFVKSATAAVLGASVLTTAVVVPGADASAKTTYKVNKNGTLVNAKTNKAVKGYKTYKGKLYKNGKKFTGKTSYGTYYVKGKKFTGKTKYGYYYVNGKRFTGTTKYGYYYVNGKRFNGKTKYGNLYVDGKRYTGTTKYGYTYYNGKRVEGEYKAKVYTNGKLVTGLYKDKLYTKGVLETGLDLYKDKLYKDGVLNVGYALYNEDLYKDAAKNEGFVADPLKDGKAYNDTKLANGTFDVDGVEKAYEDGVEVGAKVKSVEAINGKQIKVTFNKTVDDVSAEYLGNYSILRTSDSSEVKLSTLSSNIDDITADGKEVTITFVNDVLTDLSVNKDTLFKFTVDGVKDASGASVAKSTSSLSVNDEKGPELVSASAAAKTTTNKVTLTFSEPVQATGALVTVDGKSATVQAGSDYNQLVVTTSANLEPSKTYDITVLNVKDAAGNFLTTNPTKSTVTVANDVVAPTITEVKAVRDNLVAVTFDKAIDANTLSGEIKLLDASGVAKGGSITSTTSSDKKTVYVALGTENFFGNGTTFTGTLYFSDKIKDVAGNTLAATNKSVTLTKDTVAPTLKSAKHLEAGTLYTNGISYTNGALVLEFDEAVSNVATGSVKLLNASGNSVEGTYVASADSNAENSKEVIITLSSALPAGDYRVVLAGGEVADLSFQTNKNVAQTTKVTATATTNDTTKPVVTTASILETAATNLSSGTTIVVPFTDNASLDLDSIQDINNYLLNGAALPAGSYVSVAHNGTSTNAVPTDVNATIHIPKASIAKEGTQVLNVVNVKDKAGNVILPATKNVTLVDDVAPVFNSATVASNGSLVLGFSEDVVFGTAPKEEFNFKINGTNVEGTNDVITETTGTGNDSGKLVVGFNAVVDAGVDADSETTADNRVYIDVDGVPGYLAGTDILVKTGTTTAVGATTVSVSDLTSLEVSVVGSPVAANIKDGSSLNNALVKDTKKVVK